MEPESSAGGGKTAEEERGADATSAEPRIDGELEEVVVAAGDAGEDGVAYELREMERRHGRGVGLEDLLGQRGAGLALVATEALSLELREALLQDWISTRGAVKQLNGGLRGRHRCITMWGLKEKRERHSW